MIHLPEKFEFKYLKNYFETHNELYIDHGHIQYAYVKHSDHYFSIMRKKLKVSSIHYVWDFRSFRQEDFHKNTYENLYKQYLEDYPSFILYKLQEEDVFHIL